MVYLGSHFIPGYIDPRSRHQYPPQSNLRYHVRHKTVRNTSYRGGRGRQPPVFTRRQPPSSNPPPADSGQRIQPHRDDELDRLPTLMVTVPSPTTPTSQRAPCTVGSLASLDNLVAFKESMDAERDDPQSTEKVPVDVARIAQTFLNSRTPSRDGSLHNKDAQEGQLDDRPPSPYTRKVLFKTEWKKFTTKNKYNHSSQPCKPSKHSRESDNKAGSRSRFSAYAEKDHSPSNGLLAPPFQSKRPLTPPPPSEWLSDYSKSKRGSRNSRASYDSRHSCGSVSYHLSGDDQSLSRTLSFDDRSEYSDGAFAEVDRPTSWRSSYNQDRWPSQPHASHEHGQGDDSSPPLQRKIIAAETIKTSLRILKMQIDTIEKQIPSILEIVAQEVVNAAPLSPRNQPRPFQMQQGKERVPGRQIWRSATPLHEVPRGGSDYDSRGPDRYRPPEAPCRPRYDQQLYSDHRYEPYENRRPVYPLQQWKQPGQPPF